MALAMGFLVTSTHIASYSERWIVSFEDIAHENNFRGRRIYGDDEFTRVEN